MAKKKKYNPERRTWRGRSYRKGGKRVKKLKYRMLEWLDEKAPAL